MARRPRTIPVAPTHAAYLPPEWELSDAYALKSLVAGTASADQQQRAVAWIINRAAATYDMAYRPESARDTDFALGRAFVGQQVVKLINMPVSILDQMRKGPTQGEPSEQA